MFFFCFIGEANGAHWNEDGNALHDLTHLELRDVWIDDYIFASYHAEDDSQLVARIIGGYLW